jgi:hypothetical protein
VSLFGKIGSAATSLFGRRGPALAEPTSPRIAPPLTRGLSPADREFALNRADRLESEGRRTGNRVMLAQAKAIRARL